MTTTSLATPPETLSRLTPAAVHSVRALTHFGFFLSMISDGDAFMSRLGAPVPIFAEVDPAGEVNGKPLRIFIAAYGN